MTPNEIATLKAAVERLRPEVSSVIDVFYMRLFVIAPETRKMFPEDIEQQNKKFVDMIATAAGRVESLEDLEALLAELGLRHREYGTTARDYDIVREAFVWALQRETTSEFSPEMRDILIKFYDLAAAAMLRAAA